MSRVNVSCNQNGLIQVPHWLSSGPQCARRCAGDLDALEGDDTSVDQNVTLAIDRHLGSRARLAMIRDSSYKHEVPVVVKIYEPKICDDPDSNEMTALRNEWNVYRDSDLEGLRPRFFGWFQMHVVYPPTHGEVVEFKWVLVMSPAGVSLETLKSDKPTLPLELRVTMPDEFDPSGEVWCVTLSR